MSYGPPNLVFDAPQWTNGTNLRPTGSFQSSALKCSRNVGLGTVGYKYRKAELNRLMLAQRILYSDDGGTLSGAEREANKVRTFFNRSVSHTISVAGGGTATGGLTDSQANDGLWTPSTTGRSWVAWRWTKDWNVEPDWGKTWGPPIPYVITDPTVGYLAALWNEQAQQVTDTSFSITKGDTSCEWSRTYDVTDGLDVTYTITETKSESRANPLDVNAEVDIVKGELELVDFTSFWAGNSKLLMGRYDQFGDGASGGAYQTSIDPPEWDMGYSGADISSLPSKDGSISWSGDGSDWTYNNALPVYLGAAMGYYGTEFWVQRLQVMFLTKVKFSVVEVSAVGDLGKRAVKVITRRDFLPANTPYEIPIPSLNLYGVYGPYPGIGKVSGHDTNVIFVAGLDADEYLALNSATHAEVGAW